MAEANPALALLPDHDSLAKDPRATQDLSEEAVLLLSDYSRGGARRFPLQQAEEDEFVEKVCLLEKRARQAQDGKTVTKLIISLLDHFKSKGEPNESVGPSLEKNVARLKELIAMFCKKRGQLKTPVVEVMAWGTRLIEEGEKFMTRDVKMGMIRCLAGIAEGKIFIEVERSRLLKLEATMLEQDGKISEAAELLQDVQVEQFSGMERRERSEYILNQMRLMLLNQDFVRCQILSKKINPKLLQAEDMQDIKLQYYDYLAQYYSHDKDFFNIAQSCHESYKCPKTQETEDHVQFLQRYITFMILAPHSADSPKHLRQFREDEVARLKKVPTYKQLLDDFLSEELVVWPLSYEEEIKKNEIFRVDEYWALFRSRFLQHDLLTLGKYYSRMPTVRIAELLGTTIDEVESEIAKLVNDKMLYARIDRPGNVISFEKPKSAGERLDLWTSNVSELLTLLDSTTHLINNDRMVHAALKQRKELKIK